MTREGELLYLYAKAQRALDDLADVLKESGYTERAERADELERAVYHEKQSLMSTIREQGEAAGRKR